MNHRPYPKPAPARSADMRLLLRAHGEQQWLLGELAPALLALERGQVPAADRDAARAYLEALWLEACRHATHTEQDFQRHAPRCSGPLLAAAGRYHTAVLGLRAVLALRVQRVLEGALGVPCRG